MSNNVELAKVQVFENESFGSVRTIFKDGEPLFCLSDVAKVLKVQNLRQLKPTLDEEFNKRGIFHIHPLETSGGKQNFTFINESELYFLTMRSRSKKAKSFRMWVNGEVLPSIRKTGSYSIQAQLPKNFSEALRQLADKVDENEKLQAQIQAQKPLVAFAENVAKASNAISIRDFAKVLNDEEIFMGQNRLFAFLREHRFLMSNNMPYQKYIDLGYFKVIEQTFTTPYSDTPKTSFKTLITGRGQIFFCEKLRALKNFKINTAKGALNGY